MRSIPGHNPFNQPCIPDDLPFRIILELGKQLLHTFIQCHMKFIRNSLGNTVCHCIKLGCASVPLR